MNPINFLKFIEQKRPEYKWEKLLKEKGSDMPVEGKGDYVGGKKVGEFIQYRAVFNYDKGGNDYYVARRLNFSDGKIDGVQKYYNDDGTLKSEHIMMNGVKEGPQKFYRDGVLNRIENYKNNILNGERIEFFPGTDKIRTSSHYENDKKNGITDVYYESGNIHQKIKYHQGQIKSFKQFYKDVNLKREGTYTTRFGGEPQIGLEISYYPNGNKESKIDHMTRESTYYREDGSIQSERIKTFMNFFKLVQYDTDGDVTMIEDCMSQFDSSYQFTPHGERNFYDKEGNVIKTEHFKHGRLVNKD